VKRRSYPPSHARGRAGENRGFGPDGTSRSAGNGGRPAHQCFEPTVIKRPAARNLDGASASWRPQFDAEAGVVFHVAGRNGAARVAHVAGIGCRRDLIATSALSIADSGASRRLTRRDFINARGRQKRPSARGPEISRTAVMTFATFLGSSAAPPHPRLLDQAIRRSLLVAGARGAPPTMSKQAFDSETARLHGGSRPPRCARQAAGRLSRHASSKAASSASKYPFRQKCRFHPSRHCGGNVECNRSARGEETRDHAGFISKRVEARWARTALDVSGHDFVFRQRRDPSRPEAPQRPGRTGSGRIGSDG